MDNSKIVVPAGEVNDEDNTNESGTETQQETGLDVDQCIQLDNRASFRQHAAALQEVLHNSSKYRHTRLPEPSGQKPGRLQGIEVASAWDQPYNRPLSRNRESHDGLKAPPIEKIKNTVVTGSSVYGGKTQVKKKGGNLSLPPVQTSPFNARSNHEHVMKYCRHKEDVMPRLKLAAITNSKQGSTPDDMTTRNHKYKGQNGLK